MIFILFIFGASLASFAGVLADRWFQTHVFIGRSVCDFCKQHLKFRHLIPLLSWLCLKGQCAHCHKAISWKYPIAEAVSGTAFLILYLTQAPYEFYALTIISLWLVLMDNQYQELPLVGLMLLTLVGGLSGYWVTALLLTFVGILGYRQHWCGLGDIWLLGASGLWVPLTLLPYFLLMSGCFLLISRRHEKQPLAPSLLLALWLTLVV